MLLLEPLTGSRILGIDVGDDGQLALIVTVEGSKGQGPLYQRVYRADAEGTNLTKVAELDSKRIAGMVDISIGPENEVYVLTCQQNSRLTEIIYRISNKNEISEFLEISAGRDPKSLDVDLNGNVWFCTTVGVFCAVH